MLVATLLSSSLPERPVLATGGAARSRSAWRARQVSPHLSHQGVQRLRASSPYPTEPVPAQRFSRDDLEAGYCRSGNFAGVLLGPGVLVRVQPANAAATVTACEPRSSSSVGIDASNASTTPCPPRRRPASETGEHRRAPPLGAARPDGLPLFPR